VTALAVGYLALYLLALTHGAYINATLATRLRRELKESRAALQARLQEVERLQEQLREQALQDPLTGMFNRRYLDAFLERELARARRDGNPLTVMILDIDHFKQINDHYGHLFGDRVIRAIGAALKAGIKGRDFVSRYGGEEFAILLPDTPVSGALVVAENIRRTVAGSRIRRLNSEEVVGNITLSAGIAAFSSVEAGEGLFERADAALYRAKNLGRNRIVVAD